MTATTKEHMNAYTATTIINLAIWHSRAIRSSLDGRFLGCCFCSALRRIGDFPIDTTN